MLIELFVMGWKIIQDRRLMISFSGVESWEKPRRAKVYLGLQYLSNFKFISTGPLHLTINFVL